MLEENLARLKLPSANAELLLEWQPKNIDASVQANGSPSLLVKGKPAYPIADTLQTVARQSAGLVQGQDVDLVVFFGLGLGLHLEFIRHFCKAPIIVFDPDFDSLVGVLEKIPLHLEDVVLVTDIKQLTDVMKAHLGRATAQIQAGALPTWIQDHPVAFEEFKGALQQVTHLMEVDRNTRSDFEEIWISHTAENLSFLGTRSNWDVLGDQFSGKPAVLVGAGPSLDKCLKVLAGAVDKVLIVATHSAVIPLSRAGITPDLVVIVESNKLDFYFDDVQHLDEMVLIASSQTHPAHLEIGFQDILRISQEGNVAADWLQRAFGDQPVRSGGSVACAAFSVMHGLGCDPVVFVGMDLAYSETRSHAGGSREGCCVFRLDQEKGLMIRHCPENIHEPGEIPFVMVEGWGGDHEVAAHPVYSQFRQWFEAAARTWVGKRQLINATEGGSRIEGFREMSLSSVLDEFCTEPLFAKTLIREAMEKAEKGDPSLLAAAIKDELVMVENAARAAGDADKTAKKALRLLRAGQLNRVQPLLDRLQIHERHLQEFTGKTLLLNSKVGLKIQQLAAEKGQGDQVAMTIHSLEQSRRISGLIIKGAGELVDLYGSAMMKMEEGG